ncbi:MAG: TonB-dependent receptor [Georgfuchsia sp.]
MQRHQNHAVRVATAAVAVLFSFASYATEEARAPEVVVTATRTPTRTNQLLSDVSVVTRDDIDHSPATSLTELLTTIPGISITDTGGRGATTSMFIRGTNSNHSLVLIDGQRISSATVGATAFEHIPLDQIDHVEVLRGPASSLYGADAIGGVIQIFTRKGDGDKPAPSFSFGAGSYRTTTGSISYGGSSGDTRFNLSGGWESEHGKNSIKAPTGSFTDTYNQDKDPYDNTNVSAHVAQRLKPGTEIGGDYLETTIVKHSDTSNCDVFFTTCTANFDNRLHQKLRSYSVFATNQLSDDWKSSLRIGRSDDQLKNWLIDPVATTVTIDHYDTEQTQFSWQNDFSTRIGRVMAAAEWRKEAVDSSKALVVDSRTTKALVLGYQGEFGHHDVQASARIDDIQRSGTARSGSLAYGYRFDNGFTAHASMSRAFHAPTFNDLYWPVDPVNFYQGNPNLRPERAFNREIGLRYDTAYTTTSLTYFHNKVTNLLDYVPSFVAPFTGQMQNLSSATLRGASINQTLCWAAWTVRANFDALSARADATGRFLQRRVPHQGSVEVRRQFERFDLGALATYSSRRFNDNTNTQTLGGYSLLNLDANYRLTPEWSLQAKIGNLFDRDYVLLKDQFSLNEFTTPGRNFFLNVRYRPK